MTITATFATALSLVKSDANKKILESIKFFVLPVSAYLIVKIKYENTARYK